MQDQFSILKGRSVTCRKTVSESDVYMFAGITGDFSPNHVDEEFMRATSYGRRIAHGALLVGYMSRASTLMAEHCMEIASTHYPVSLGYDRIRFLHAVGIGDTVQITYEITGGEEARLRTVAEVSVRNQHGVLCMVATHIMCWMPRATA